MNEAHPLTLSDPETARSYVDAVASMSRIGEGDAYLGREMLLANYTGVEPTLPTLAEVEAALDRFDAGGRSRYLGSYRGRLEFNVDKRWQRDVFTQILCHEAYPGHQTFYALWDHGFRTGTWPLEAALYTRNAPTNAIFEGGPEVAMHLVGWDVGDTREAAALRVGQLCKDLERIAMNDVCLGLNTGEMSEAQALARLEEPCVLPDDAVRVVRFVTDPVSRTHYPQYYYGRRIVDLALRRMERDADLRRRFIDILYRTPHTTRTFIAAVEEATGAPFDPFAYG